MTNKRTLKKTIKLICEELFAECVAVSLYASKPHQDNVKATLLSIVQIQNDFTARICHPEPGLSAKLYYKDLREKFTAQVNELLDQINNMN